MKSNGAQDRQLIRPWWPSYGRIVTKPIDGMPADIAASFKRVCEQFIHRHAAEAELHGWQPAHLLGPKGLGRSWALIEFMPEVARFEPMAMIYPSPTGAFLLARRANRDGTVSLIQGEDYLLMCGRHLALRDACLS